MSTNATIAIQTAEDTWTHIYVHFDAYPDRMLEILPDVSMNEVLRARNIRFISDTGSIEAFEDPHSPVTFPEPTRTQDYLYWLDENDEWQVE